MARIRHTDTDEGWINRELAKLRREIREQAAAKRLPNASGSIWVDRLTVDLANDSWPSDTTWRTYAEGSVTVPAGFTQLSYALFVAAGATFPGAGMVGVQPRVNGATTGPSISSGVPGASPCSVTSFVGDQIAVTPGDVLTFGLRAYASGASNAGSCNAHTSVMLTWIR